MHGSTRGQSPGQGRVLLLISGQGGRWRLGSGPLRVGLMEFGVLARSDSPVPLQAFCSAGPCPRGCPPHATPPHTDPRCFLMRSRNSKFAFSSRNSPSPGTCPGPLPFTSLSPSCPAMRSPHGWHQESDLPAHKPTWSPSPAPLQADPSQTTRNQASP